MRLFITTESQEIEGFHEILRDTDKDLDFVTNRDKNLENIDNYGTEFALVCIIPTCMNDEFWDALGWKERRQIWRKKRETDIRLKMDFYRFEKETYANKRLMFIDIIIKSIRVIIERSKGDFKGEELIQDILKALNVSKEDLNLLNQ